VVPGVLALALPFPARSAAVAARAATAYLGFISRPSRVAVVTSIVLVI
jgi:hypothetical protein